MNKRESILKKLSNFSPSGFLEGVINKNTNKENIEILAKERSSICSECPENIIEPIEYLRIKDENNASINERCCNKCGCALPYMTRQLKKGCPLKKW